MRDNKTMNRLNFCIPDISKSTQNWFHPHLNIFFFQNESKLFELSLTPLIPMCAARPSEHLRKLWHVARHSVNCCKSMSGPQESGQGGQSPLQIYLNIFQQGAEADYVHQISKFKDLPTDLFVYVPQARSSHKKIFKNQSSRLSYITVNWLQTGVTHFRK